MKTNRREIKWAIWGFVAGFVLCYLLVGSFGPRTPSGATANAGAMAALLRVQAQPQIVRVTNQVILRPSLEFAPRAQWIQIPDANPAMLAPALFNRNYSLELIDKGPPPMVELPDKQ